MTSLEISENIQSVSEKNGCLGYTLQDNEHFVRYLRPKWWDAEKKELNYEKAFVLRDNEDYVSCNWYEYHNNILKVIDDIKSKFDCSPKGRFAYLSVKEFKNIASAFLIDLYVQGVSTKDSHSGIFGIGENIDFQKTVCEFVAEKIESDSRILTSGTERYNLVGATEILSF
uniref:hypothetical protein n=1 Tax=Candidatus Scatocola faecigallinarum TaxID=2840916 RepID=UPI0040298D60